MVVPCVGKEDGGEVFGWGALEVDEEILEAMEAEVRAETGEG